MTDSLREWLRAEILAVPKRQTLPPPLVLWCDPERAWRDLLRPAAEGGAFELWSEEQHELVLRERLLTAPPGARVVWLPMARDEIRYLKVFELEADLVWTDTLTEALGRFGVELARDHQSRLRALLPAYAKEWLDRPRAAWQELSPGSVLAALADDDRVLQALATPGVPLADLFDRERLGVFVRRVDEDFGLPRPVPGADDDWRVAATTRLLVTDAAVRAEAEPLGTGELIIPLGAARDNALRLLDRWQKHVELMAAFEELACRADGRLSLGAWVLSMPGSVPPLASRAAEEALFQRDVEQLGRLETFEAVARRLEEREPFYAAHARGFWGNLAQRRVAWPSLVSLARAAGLLATQAGIERQWKTPADAVAWFVPIGWEIDRQGEILFRDDRLLPPPLKGVRAHLRRAYLRHVDACNSAFSELLHAHGVDTLQLPFAGEALAACRPQKDAMAVLVLDACRFDLGMRIAEMLNRGEPVPRAEVQAARAPVPSVTAIGMPFALADDAAALVVQILGKDDPEWRVTGPQGGDLASAGARREWLKRRFKLKPIAITDTKTVLDAGLPQPREAGRLVFVFGDEFDTQGHEGELRFIGAEEYIERYVRVIRRLRDAGYGTVVVVTDHGFIQWEPEKDEVEALPTGDLAWRSRRAAVGRELAHPTALALPVPGSDLECRVPRSVNAFRTYGGLGFFHGGATLQELVIPVVVCRWPRKTQKVPAVLTPFAAITSLRPRVEVRPGATGHLPEVGPGADVTGRQIIVKVVESATGRRLFQGTESVTVEPGGPGVPVTLERQPGETCPRGARLRVEVRDADNDELLDHCEVELSLDLEEWD